MTIHDDWEHVRKGVFVGGADIIISLPAEIFVEILIRLPVQTILECRAVCKHWKTFTSTPDFIHKYFLKQQATPSIVVAYRKKHWPFHEDEEVILYINDWGSASVSAASGSSTSLLARLFERKNINIKRLRPGSVFQVPSFFRLARFCNNGLLLFSESRKTVIVCNPVTQEKSKQYIKKGDICACFYQPLAKEYRLIWCGQNKSYTWKFKILKLGGEVSSRTYFARQPRWYCGPPVVLNNKEEGDLLLWMIADTYTENQQQPCSDCEESIIVFNTSSETFSAMPHPGDQCQQNRHNHMHLLDMKIESGSGTSSLLCLCDCTVPGEIEMWVLEDYHKRVWERRQKIFVGMEVINVVHDRSGRTVPFGLINGELLFRCHVKGVFAYNINNKTIRKINGMPNGITYAGLHPFQSCSLHKIHTTST